MAKKLPPIFKMASTSVQNNNRTYYYSNEKKEGEKQIETSSLKEAGIEQTLDKIFNTRGYAFNIPVRITFAGKQLDAYLATRTKTNIITLENESIPISTITKLEIKNPIEY